MIKKILSIKSAILLVQCGKANFLNKIKENFKTLLPLYTVMRNFFSKLLCLKSEVCIIQGKFPTTISNHTCFQTVTEYSTRYCDTTL